MLLKVISGQRGLVDWKGRIMDTGFWTSQYSDVTLKVSVPQRENNRQARWADGPAFDF